VSILIRGTRTQPLAAFILPKMALARAPHWKLIKVVTWIPHNHRHRFLCQVTMSPLKFSRAGHVPGPHY